MNLATVLGVPFETLLAQRIDWRATFVSIAVLALLASALILIAIPDDGNATERTSLRHELRAFAKWQVIGTVFATVLCSGGMFALITYMVPLLTHIGGIPPHGSLEYSLHTVSARSSATSSVAGAPTAP